MAAELPEDRRRRRLTFEGVVQGVGFRPHVYALARALGLSGVVWNEGARAVVEVEGSPAGLDAFGERVRAEAPPLAVIVDVGVQEVAVRGGTGFEIRSSARGSGRTYVSPDVGICEDCLADLRDPADRRYRHPFVTCTSCGPRFTITTRLPYDRPTTTMAGFAMCADCAREYADPHDRRFHAQTICCPACGPRLRLEVPAQPVAYAEEALAKARSLLRQGATVAVKGVGGYHLACDATSEDAVALLRKRKRRGDKPFAVMVASSQAACQLVHLSPAELALLELHGRPIVLAARRTTPSPAVSIAESVAPGSADLGVLVAYTPLHHLLLGLPGDAPGPPALVMTSGNLAGEPIVTDDAAARGRLAEVADAWLSHDRPIRVPCDDSVTRVVAGAEAPVRRSRGYAPLPINLPFDAPAALAVGGDLKNTFAVAHRRLAWLSAHVGDLDDPATLSALTAAEAQLEALTEVVPEVLACDRHPGYRSRRWADQHAAGRPVEKVQHHHAHVASTMADHGLPDGHPVIGIAFDGTGYGDDGAAWGGEFLVADYRGYARSAHLAYVPLPGGDAGVRNPCRMALSHLRSAGVGWSPALPCVRACDDVELGVLDRQLETGLHCVPTSSMGRLFDAVSSLAGIRHRVDYDAQAAMELESCARGHVVRRGYRFGPDADAGPVVAAAAEDVLAGTEPGLVAARFQAAVVDLVVAVASRIRAESGLGRVTLSGGVFLNALLTSACAERLAGAGFDVLRHTRVPASDAGLALGQIAVLAHRVAPERRPTSPEQESACA